MTDAEFDQWREPKIRQYALDKAAAGNWRAAEAQQLSVQSFQQAFPQGRATPHQYLFTIETLAETQTVGFLWFAVNTQGPTSVAFLYDFIILAPFRRQGYAAHALQCLEAEVQALGLEAIALHVFGHNQAAQQLYAKMGYVATNINMVKKLGPLQLPSMQN